MKPSRLKYWLNFVALSSGLVLCIFFILMLKSEHGRQFWASLGFGSDGDTLNWCTNRVQTLKLPINNGSLVEESGKWLWKAPDLPDVELDYLTVEKWFAKHCQIPIKKVDFQDFNSRLLPLIEVEFVDGETAIFYDLGKERIQMDTFIFRSEAFQKAFQELQNFSPEN